MWIWFSWVPLISPGIFFTIETTLLFLPTDKVLDFDKLVGIELGKKLTCLTCFRLQTSPTSGGPLATS